MSNLLDAASLYAERGLYVTPVWSSSNGVCACPRGVACVSPGKHPVLDSWQTSASTDLTMLRDWFVSGDRNIGIVCSSSDICVIDIDPRNGGDAAFTALVAELGALPPTLTADSGGGGTHYVFRRPPGDLISKLGTGIDFLRDGRQFLVEPSVHPSGGHYRWRTGMAPDEIRIAALPAAWQKRVTRAAPTARVWMPPAGSTDLRIERARKYLSKLPGAVAGDSGHTRTFHAVSTVMFGFDLDEETTLGIIASDFNPRCDPPWSEAELRHKIASCAKSCQRPRGYLLDTGRRPVYTTEQAASEMVPSEAEGADYLRGVQKNKQGFPRRGYANVLNFVRNFPDYQGKWSLNSMTKAVLFDGVVTEETFSHDVRAHIDRQLEFSPGPEDVNAAILTVAQERKFHPIQQYLRSVDWDGVPRLHEMAGTYLNSRVPIHGELVRKWMISAVSRALNPGSKVDTALMLSGKQGFFKSWFFVILGGSWHADSHLDITNKDSYQQIHAAWIYEFAELENVVHGKAESRLKGWITSKTDIFRAPYEKVPRAQPRSCVICGTTNRAQFLTDETGSRRFWIIDVTQRIPRELLAANRDQLWAEAVCAYDAGEPWWLDESGDAELERQNKEFEEEDAWFGACERWVTACTRAEFTTSDVMEGALKLETARQDRTAQTRVGRILKQLGYDAHRRGSHQRFYRLRSM